MSVRPGLLAVRDAIAETLKTNLTVLKTSRGYSGSLDVAEIKRQTSGAVPAVLVVCEGVADSELRGGTLVVADVIWTAFILAMDDMPNKWTRGDIAMGLAGAVLNEVRREKWGLDTVQASSRARAKNEYTTEIDKLGVAVWSVQWRQKCTLPVDETAANITAFTGVDATFTDTDGNELSQVQATIPQGS